ncbi:hypothetical protein CEXT_641781 [Caerostris extrusa]|uniref:Uncharacterized protein n=1 Tax=Caerostris extrusa TaxID=172846 RepID=A0AAV4PBJ0_CAEEX|nr:hypothetical protein CEXT_641781 [Caerostris extrusa]
MPYREPSSIPISALRQFSNVARKLPTSYLDEFNDICLLKPPIYFKIVSLPPQSILIYRSQHIIGPMLQKPETKTDVKHI